MFEDKPAKITAGRAHAGKKAEHTRQYVGLLEADKHLEEACDAP